MNYEGDLSLVERIEVARLIDVAHRWSYVLNFASGCGIVGTVLVGFGALGILRLSPAAWSIVVITSIALCLGLGFLAIARQHRAMQRSGEMLFGPTFDYSAYLHQRL